MDIGKFVKHDQQRFVVGSLANQIRTLIQRMKMRGYKPWKILLSRGLREALRMELNMHDQGDKFEGLLIKIDDSVNEPIIMIEPKLAPKPEAALSTWGKHGSYVSH